MTWPPNYIERLTGKTDIEAARELVERLGLREPRLGRAWVRSAADCYDEPACDAAPPNRAARRAAARRPQ